MSKKNSIKITTQITKTGRIRVKTTTTTRNGHSHTTSRTY